MIKIKEATEFSGGINKPNETEHCPLKANYNSRYCSVIYELCDFGEATNNLPKNCPLRKGDVRITYSLLAT